MFEPSSATRAVAGRGGLRKDFLFSPQETTPTSSLLSSKMSWSFPTLLMSAAVRYNYDTDHPAKLLAGLRLWRDAENNKVRAHMALSLERCSSNEAVSVNVRSVDGPVYFFPTFITGSSTGS